jgi:hypothetical protein
MADIELVIKIPEEIQLALINNIQLSLDQQSRCDAYIKQAIINGTPLNKERNENDALDKIKEDVKKWYWEADKQKLAEDPCVVDAMIDLFIRTINKYKSES